MPLFYMLNKSPNSRFISNHTYIVSLRHTGSGNFCLKWHTNELLCELLKYVMLNFFCMK